MPLIKCFGYLIAIAGPFVPSAVITAINGIYLYLLDGSLLVAVFIQLAAMLLLVLIMDSISERLSKKARCNTCNTACFEE